ncbi:glycosyltransferase family 2 protein [Methylobacterium organophilum]|uniref:N-acetylglucosaminyl-diphospho-decaprenol L-rhamnosyltransferase n=1 Tax=Methylobacterium organophilum TaxID=410 RepID=A0ABQ4TF41_METOR|nr:glycosyltransferase family 2 protein [Methylobacterium organophilum]GJE29666.1 N-acetylglucosaminyl-diphospho-decaprenol L-rhamnosyltransferase [Methylobacterium organophilum]
MTPPSLDVVIVNWNAGPQLAACLASLAASREASALKVIVVDNASSDGSVDGLDVPGLALSVIRNRENRGFAAACNQGAAAGRAEAILFLNPDTMVAPDSLVRARAALFAEPATGVVGARLVDEAGRTQRTCARTPSGIGLVAQTLFLDRLGLAGSHFMRDWDHESPRAVDAVMGAFLMIRRPLFEKLGGFDERFFVYWEDADLCTRVGQAGFALRHVAEAEVRHRGQGTTEAVKDRRLFYFLRAQALYAAKHHGPAVALAVLAAAILGQIPIRLARALLKRAPEDLGAVLRAELMLLRALPGLLPRLFRA